MASGIDYSIDEWAESTGHRPLRAVAPPDLVLLHRHWMWANIQREAFDRLLRNPSLEALSPGHLMMATRELGFMFTWYGLLWSVFEAFEHRRVEIRGEFRTDIDGLSDRLRRCRNAVMHVPEPGVLLDSRIEGLMVEHDSATTIRRIHRGVGRMFLEEMQFRASESGQPPIKP